MWFAYRSVLTFLLYSQAEFCPPLDSSLLTALLLDFPTPTTADESSLRRTLSLLSSTASESEPSSSSSNQASTDATSTSDVTSWLEVWSLDEDEEREAGGGEGHDDPVQFILTVFPKREAAEIEMRLREAGEDVQRVMEDFLSEDAIAEGIFEDFPLGTEDDDFAFATSLAEEAEDESPRVAKREPKNPEAASIKAFKRRQKSLLKASSTLSLTSTSHLPRPAPTPPHPATTVAAGYVLPTKSALSQASRSTNHWVSLQSLSAHLSTLINLSPLHISSFFHSSALPSSASLSTLLERVARKRPPRDLGETIAFWELLGLMDKGTQWQRDRAEEALRACEGRVEDAWDLLEVVKDGEEGAGRVGAIVLAPPPTTITSVPSSGFSTPSIRSSLPPKARLPPPEVPGTDAEWATAAECEEYAREFLMKRNEAYRAGARHFQKGSRGDRGAAWYWAEEGREMGRKAKVWQERGARALVGERRYETSALMLV
ncbi:hypothetical protein P7C70_g2201, partial [Phenoliferia sp. Uapishka_3]